MAHNTNNPFIYDCGTCSEPVYYNHLGWFHHNRNSACEIVSVVEVPLVRVEITAAIVELVA